MKNENSLSNETIREIGKQISKERADVLKKLAGGVGEDIEESENKDDYER